MLLAKRKKYLKQEVVYEALLAIKEKKKKPLCCQMIDLIWADKGMFLS